VVKKGSAVDPVHDGPLIHRQARINHAKAVMFALARELLCW